MTTTAPTQTSPPQNTPAQTSRAIRPGFVAHTELASNDPAATKAWCQKVLGWSFGPPMDMPDGEAYHMWQFGDTGTGGGIRRVNGPEHPGSIPYCEVKDLKESFNNAIRAGAKEMMAPVAIPGTNGAMAIVQAPGGPAIGLWSNRL